MTAYETRTIRGPYSVTPDNLCPKCVSPRTLPPSSFNPTGPYLCMCCGERFEPEADL